jgi:RNase P/RNase MRP subunit p30
MATDIALFKNQGSLFFRKISKRGEAKNDDCDGFLLDMDEKEARKTIDFLKCKNKKVAVIAGDDEFNRRVVETLKIDYLVSPENNSIKDSLKQRASGMNHVIAEIAKKKNIQIVEDLTWLNNLQGKKKAIAISRVIQNVKICRKSNCQIKIATFAKQKEELFDQKQMTAIAFSFQMSSQQAKNAYIF